MIPGAGQNILVAGFYDQGASSPYGDEEAEKKLIFRIFAFPFLFHLDSQPRK